MPASRHTLHEGLCGLSHACRQDAKEKICSSLVPACYHQCPNPKNLQSLFLLSLRTTCERLRITDTWGEAAPLREPRESRDLRKGTEQRALLSLFLFFYLCFEKVLLHIALRWSQTFSDLQPLPPWARVTAYAGLMETFLALSFPIYF